MTQSYNCLRDVNGTTPCLYDADPALATDIIDFLRYRGVYPSVTNLRSSSVIASFKPYSYGWPVEVNVRDTRGSVAGNFDVIKQYGFGRLGASGIMALPDGRTTYLSGGHGGLFMFRSTNVRRQGITAEFVGTLYAARFTATQQPPAADPPVSRRMLLQQQQSDLSSSDSSHK